MGTYNFHQLKQNDDHTSFPSAVSNRPSKPCKHSIPPWRYGAMCLVCLNYLSNIVLSFGFSFNQVGVVFTTAIHIEFVWNNIPLLPENSQFGAKFFPSSLPRVFERPSRLHSIFLWRLHLNVKHTEWEK